VVEDGVTVPINASQVDEARVINGREQPMKKVLLVGNAIDPLAVFGYQYDVYTHGQLLKELRDTP